jgi:hypothetical protein
MTYEIVVQCAPTEETLVAETFVGAELKAEQRMGDLWNKHAAHLPDRGIVATMTRAGESQPCMWIEG